MIELIVNKILKHICYWSQITDWKAGGGSTRLKAFLLTSSPTPTYKNVAAFVQLGAGENMQTSWNNKIEGGKTTSIRKKHIYSQFLKHIY